MSATASLITGVDFVAVHFWPTFNVADASIVVGCLLLLVSLARGSRL